MSPTPIPVIVVGKSEAVGGAVVEGIVPEYEGKSQPQPTGPPSPKDHR